jgi:putative ABC transport system permease protein
MRRLISLRSFWRTLFRSTRLDRDLDSELREYVDAVTDRRVQSGLPPAAARRSALLDCEGIEQTKEKVRDARVGARVESVVRDLRFAARGLRRNPGFAAAAILTLSLGIGVTVAIFSSVLAVLLRPLPYRNPQQLVFVFDEADGEATTMSPARFVDVRHRATGLSGIAGFSEVPVNLVGGETPERLLAATVSTDFFEVLGVKALLGRTFDVGREHQRVVVLSHGLWTRRFGRDPSIVGRDITLDSGSHTVAGVMPSDFTWLPRGGAGPKPELWIPAPVREVPALAPGTNVERLTEQRDISYLVAVARMKPGRTVREVNAGLAVLARELAAQYPATDKKHGLRALAAMEHVAGDARTPLLLLLGAVSLVLVVACANVANLLLGRTLARRGEIAVRLALGAGRARLARQFLAEALVLSGMAAGLGVLLAHATLASLVAFSPADIARLGETRVDGVVLGFAVLLAIGTAAALAVVPVMDVRRMPALLHEASRRTSGRRRGGRTLLLIGEVAVAVMLVIGAGLLVRSFVALQRVNTGIFRPGQLLTFNLLIGAERAATPERQAPFYQEVLDRIRALPQVRAAGAALTLPMSGDDFNTSVYFEGRPAPPAGQQDRAGFQPVTPGYFGTLGVRLLAGRDIGIADGADAPKVVVVNDTFARRFWGQESPLGRRLKFGPSATAALRTIVGVVQDVRHRGPAEPARAELFLPVAQLPFPSMAFVVRTDGDPLRLVPSIRAAVAAIDAAQPLADVQTVEAYVQRSMARTRFLAGLLTGLGGLALLLAAVGLYGVMSWSVVERRHEIGIRMAVGATPAAVAGMVLRQGGVHLGIGLLAGGSGAAGLSRVLSGVLFGVRAGDAATYLSTVAILALVGVAALWLPAHRASRLDPSSVLRE